MKPVYNILHLLPMDRLNGAERIVQLVGRNLNPETFKPVLVCRGDPLRGIYEEDGHIVETADVSRPTPRNIIRLRTIIIERNIHLIHAHDHRASLTAWISTRFFRHIPIVSHIHNTNPWLKQWHPLKVLELIMRNRYDTSIACSETVRNYYIKHNSLLKRDKILTVTNGIEIKEYQPVNRGAVSESLGISLNNFIFGTVGRLDDQKGIDLLLHSFKKVTEALENVTLLIVGTGSNEQDLKKLTKELGLEDHVVFAGYRDNIYDIFQVMDIFVLASRWEGLPMVLMEAMVQGLPVIATDVGGISELVKSTKTGFLVQKGDIAELAQKMIFAYENRVLMVEMGLNGKELVKQNNDMAVQVQKIEELYIRLLRGKDPC